MAKPIIRKLEGQTAAKTIKVKGKSANKTIKIGGPKASKAASG